MNENIKYVISLIIPTLLKFGLEKIFADEKIENKVIAYFFDEKYSLASLIAFSLTALILGCIITKKIIANEKDSTKKMQESFLKKCSKSVLVDKHISIEYDVDFDPNFDPDLPTPHNLILRCPTCRINTTIIDHRQCINADICEQPCYVKKCSFDNFDKFKTRQRDRIKSILINEWREFRGLNFIGRMFWKQKTVDPVEFKRTIGTNL